MTITLIRYQADQLPKFLSYDDYSINIIEIDSLINSNNTLDYDTLLDSLIKINSALLKSSDLILISHLGDNQDKFLGLRLIYHLRFDKNFRIKPIVLSGEKSFIEIIKEIAFYGYQELALILFTYGISYQSDNELNCTLIHYLHEELKLNTPRTEEEYVDNFLRKIIIHEPDEQYSSHGIANEWGAYRLAQVAGLDITHFDYPKTLYFKYLLAYQDEENLAITSCQPFWLDNLSVLYIDDNEHKGWSQCLKLLLDKRIISYGSATVISHKTWDIAIENDIKNDKFDLIFLDYYLPNGKKGDEILSYIKTLNPVLPVIMFTASNKAWNMDKLYEMGVDGYYVKEHPQTAKDWAFSVQNFNEFHITIEKCLKKGTRLRRYYRKIREIATRSIIVNPLGDVIKERINERLYMFLGLLKKEFEESKFDSDSFFYSDIELAFLTLWSVLNEIQHAFYEKNNDFIPFTYSDSIGPHLVSNHPIGGRVGGALSTSATYSQTNWKIRNTQDYLILYKSVFDTSGRPVNRNSRFYEMAPYTKILLDDSTTSGFRTFNDYIRISNNDTRKTYTKNLFMQIAYLIEKLPSISSVNKTYLLQNLLASNQLRNKLYLTHGEDTLTTYSDLVESQRDPDLETKCRRLFEIVYFLNTGTECIW